MPGIKVKDSESFDEAYRRFKKQCDRNLIVTETRARRFFEPMTEKRKNKKLTLEKKCLKDYICLEDTNLGCNQRFVQGGVLPPFFIPKFISLHISKNITLHSYIKD